MSELQESSNSITELYDGVWGNEIVSGTNKDLFANSTKALKSMFPELFNKTNPLKPTGGSQYISMYDASELLRRSLNYCVRLLRNSKNGLDLPEFSNWADAYYQTSLLLFGEKGLTPYKLKLTLFPSLVRSGFIYSPWFHMCEGLEKSNHHAHKDFQSRTMRGGGLIHNQDPLFLECCFSFCKVFKLAATRDKTTELSIIQSQTCEAVYGVTMDQLPSRSYRQICQESCETPTIAVGQSRGRNCILAGLRFFVTGTYGGTEAVAAGKRLDPTVTPQRMVEQWIRELGGEVFTKNALHTLFYHHSQTPHCFIVLKDGEELKKGTMTAEELAADKRPRDTPRSAVDSTDNDSDTSRTSATRVKLSEAAKFCREFAGGQLTFIKLDYIIKSLRSDVVLDPYSDRYRLLPGSNVKEVKVKDIRPLLMHQISQDNDTGRHVSAIVALKRYRNDKKVSVQTGLDDDSQTTMDDDSQTTMDDEGFIQ